MLKRQVHKAQIVYNGMGTAREDAAVVLQDDDIITVDWLKNLHLRQERDTLSDHGFAISPTPVNAHTHLDLSSMPLKSGRYSDFIAAVINHSRVGKRNLEATQQGLAEIKKSGISVIGDIVTDEASMRWLLAEADIEGVAYWEVFSPNPDDAERVFNETLAKLRTFRKLERPGGMRLGLSPHTPHTVSEPLLVKLAQLARQSSLPMQIHVAESPEEHALYTKGSGPLADFYAKLGIDTVAKGLSPVGYLEKLGVLEAQPSLIHMIHVNQEDIRAVQRAGCVVVHCPRSNDLLNCGRFPWEDYMRQGVEVALGTDSSASCPDLDIHQEAYAALEKHGPHISPKNLVRAAVKGGYRALGLETPRFGRGDRQSQLHYWPAPR